MDRIVHYLMFLDMNFLDRIMAGHNFLSTELSSTLMTWTDFSLHRTFLDIIFSIHCAEISLDRIFLELIFWTESS